MDINGNNKEDGKMLENKLYGCVVPIVTPLTDDQKVDVKSLENLTEY